MSPTKRAAARPAGRFKATSLMVSLALVLALGVGATLAYIATASDPVPNAFEPRKVEVSIAEKFEDQVKSDITFSNEVDIPVFVRATLAVWWTDAEGTIVSQPEGCGTPKPKLKTDGGWFAVGNVYYHTQALNPEGQEGDETGVMLEPLTATVSEGYQLHIDVLYEAIQAQPADAVLEAWGSDVVVAADSTLRAKA